MAERHAEQVGTKLFALLEDQDFGALKTETLLQEYRVACEGLILENFEDATSKNIEGKLWEAHLRINGRFRKQLAHLCEIRGRRKSVEQRKAARSYLSFLKSSQRYYRGYTQKLVSHFGGNDEVAAIAQLFSLNTTSLVPAEKKHPTPHLKYSLLQSCHRTLIRLGDLSRYRESNLDFKDKKKNWGPAIGFYDLAISIHPSSGIPYNQLAIISKAEGNRIRALYHLYRAQSSYEPPPTACDNLCLELRKIREVWELDGRVVDASVLTDDPVMNLQRWFPLLHSYCFGGIASQDYDQLEWQVLTQLSILLENRTFDDANVVKTMVLSNIAADFAAGDRWQENPDEVRNEQAFRLCQRLNVRSFSALLRLLETKYLQRTSETNAALTDKIPPLVRKLLPSLRYYSSWLISRAPLLSVPQGDSKMARFVNEFWTAYAEALSLLISETRFGDLPPLKYLLDEDEEITGFRPLQEGQVQRKCTISGTSIRKPKYHELGVERHPPHAEMLSRIRDFLEDALELTRHDYVPIKFVQESNRFLIQDSPTELERASTPLGEADEAVAAGAKSAMPTPRSSRFDTESTTDDAVSQELPALVLPDIRMNRIQNDNTGPESWNQLAATPFVSLVSRQPLTQGNGVNEVSYGIGDSTLNALHTIDQSRERVPEGQLIPFQRTSQHEALSQSQQLSHVSIKSSSSSSNIPDPTQPSQGLSHLPRLHPARRMKTYGHDQRHTFVFNSSSIFPDSSDCVRRGNAAQLTPPNGQG